MQSIRHPPQASLCPAMSRLLISTNPATTNNASLSGRANTPALATSGRRPSYISCKQQPQPETNPNNEKNVIDRRNVLLGLTSAYGATATFGSTAFANPIQPPDLQKCHLATDAQLPEGQCPAVKCCPPKYEGKKRDFELPKVTCMRTRRPAHKVDSEYIAKYEEAIRKMKALPEDDPWSFYQQAQVHCAFCNGAYDQPGFRGIPLQVHFAYLFFPWHRYYVYFWEKILGKLIGDPTFAVPFWNWDTPAGMYLPSIYKPETSPLYDPNRNPDHNEALMSYKYKYRDANPTPDEKDDVILCNLLQIESIFTEGKKNPKLFMGGPISAGEGPADNDMGSLESLHNVVHKWVGPVDPPNWDMGDFHTAARDTVFWGHHANVDRMWSLFTASRGNKPEFRSKDWLDASFIFYDDNRQLVECKVKDCLDTTKLGYTYEPVELPWLNVRPRYIKQKREREKREREREKSGVKPEEVDVGEFGSTPRPLVQTIRVLVPRPKPSLTKDDKEEVSEVLTIDDIVIEDETVPQRFDVYVSKPLEGGKATTDLGEFAGAFTYIPVSLSNRGKTRLTLGITYLVENIEADASENLVVSLIPGIGQVTIGGVKIGLLDVDD